MVRENGDSPHDEAAEKMLSPDNDKEKLAEKNVEVKFTTGESQNGDAKIDIGNIEKTFTGMTKEELMKYANDPFWIRLRWFLFILFWAAWIAMLVGAILIIVYAPRCEKPTPLVWWKKGPLVTLKDGEEIDPKELQNLGAKGVVIEIKDTDTYLIDSVDVQKKIKDAVEKYNAENIEVIVDLTPNYVTKEDPLFQEASNGDETKRSAFVFLDKSKTPPKHWVQVASNGSAWDKVGDGHYLSQFGKEKYDLQLGNEVAQNKLKAVLSRLSELGVKGFRLANAKHFVIKSDGLTDEGLSTNTKGHDLTEYGFYTHKQSTFQAELGEVLQIFARAVHNYTDGEGFLTIKDDMYQNPEGYYIRETTRYGFDLPHFNVPKWINSKEKEAPLKLKQHFQTIFNDERKFLWPHWSYTSENFEILSKKGYNMFMLLLPGLPVVNLDTLKDGNKTDVKELIEARDSEVFMHGTFEFFTSKNDTVFGFTRVRSGNPGYFVAINPTDQEIDADFSDQKHISSELSASMLDDTYDENDKKFLLNNLKLKPKSAVWLTFVPQN